MERNDRLKLARERRGFATAKEAARFLGVAYGTYSGHEAGTRGIKPPDLERYAKAFRVPLRWLALGQGELGEGGQGGLERVPVGQEFPPDIPADDGEPTLAGDRPYEPTIRGARPEIDVRPGAGHGTVGDHLVLGLGNGQSITGHRVTGEWVFPPDYWRHELHIAPAGAVIMQVIGDSMIPALLPGDRVVVDMQQDRFGPDGIYVFDDGQGEPSVKSLRRVIGSKPTLVEIISANDRYPRQTVPLAAIRILGRVGGKFTKL